VPRVWDEGRVKRAKTTLGFTVNKKTAGVLGAGKKQVLNKKKQKKNVPQEH